MSTIREVMEALNERDGVDGAFVIGSDGLTIDFAVSGDLDGDTISALVPGVVKSCKEFTEASEMGEFGSSVIEFGKGKVIVAELSAEAILAVLVDDTTNLGPILYEVKQHQPAIAALL
jgi:predicted regulator of Ras-like GTPase activity (Roadblock/LC7/MglB family)